MNAKYRQINCHICIASLLYPCCPNIKPFSNFINPARFSVLDSYELHSLAWAGSSSQQTVLQEPPSQTLYYYLIELWNIIICDLRDIKWDANTIKHNANTGGRGGVSTGLGTSSLASLHADFLKLTKFSNNCNI